MKIKVNILRCVVLFSALPFLRVSINPLDGISLSSLEYLPVLAVLTPLVAFLPSPSRPFMACWLVAIVLVALHTVVLLLFHPGYFVSGVSHLLTPVGLWMVLPLGILRQKG